MIAVLWSVPAANLVVRDIPVPAFHWQICVYGAFGWVSLLFIVFLMRYLDLRWPRFERILVIYAAFGPVLMFAAGPVRLNAVADSWLFLMIPVGMFFAALMIRKACRERTVEAGLPAIAFALVIAATIHTGLVDNDMLAFDSFHVLPYFMMLSSLVFGWHLTNRFVRALNVAETRQRRARAARRAEARGTRSELHASAGDGTPRRCRRGAPTAHERDARRHRLAPHRHARPRRARRAAQIGDRSRTARSTRRPAPYHRLDGADRR